MLLLLSSKLLLLWGERNMNEVTSKEGRTSSEVRN